MDRQSEEYQDHQQGSQDPVHLGQLQQLQHQEQEVVP